MTENFILDYIDDFAGDALDRLPSRFNDSPTVQAFVQGLGDASQLFEDLCWDVLTSSLLHHATGDQLEQWGSVLNIRREGLSDSDYRDFIRAGILARLVDGDSRTYTRLWKQVTQPTRRVKWFTHAERGIRMETYRYEFMSDVRKRKTKRVMQRAKPAARDLKLVEIISDVSTSGSGFSKARTL